MRFFPNRRGFPLWVAGVGFRNCRNNCCGRRFWW